MRFLPPLAATATGDIEFDGDEGARARPMTTTISSLREIGVAVSDDGRGGLPFTVHATGDVPAGRSSSTPPHPAIRQWAVAQCAPLPQGVTVVHRGSAIPRCRIST